MGKERAREREHLLVALWIGRERGPDQNLLLPFSAGHGHFLNRRCPSSKEQNVS